MEKNHELTYWAWTTSYPPEYWQGHHSDNAHKPQTNNITNIDDKELDKLIDIYRNSIDTDERVKLSLKIQEIIYNYCEFIPTFMVPYVREGYWRWWKLPDHYGVKASDVSMFYPFNDPNSTSTSIGGLFWIDEEAKKETLQALKTGKKFEPVTMIDETYKMEILKNKK